MTRYIAFFSSLQAGGQRLTMADLRYAMEREDLENIETVVTNGNILFEYEDRPSQGLEDMLRHVLMDRFDFEDFVAVRNAEEVRAAIEQNPFTGMGKDHEVHTLFLEGEGDTGAFDKMAAIAAERGPEKMALGTRCIYIDYGAEVGASKLTNAFIERRLGLRGTARNVRTLARILTKLTQPSSEAE